MRSPLLLALCAAVLASCESLSDYRFGPSPQTHELALQGRDTPIATAQISARGILNNDGRGLEMRFRFRVTNPGETPLEIRPGSFELVDGALRAFGPAALVGHPPGEALVLGPHETTVFDVSFPFPEGAGLHDMDLTGLGLRWGVVSDGKERLANARFELRTPYYGYYPYYPYYGYWGPWGPYYGFGFTYHVH